MSGSGPSNALFDVSTIGLLLKYCPLLFPVSLLIAESLMLFLSVVLFPVLYLFVNLSPLVSAAPPAFASIVNPLPIVIVADRPISDSERKIHELFPPFGVKIIEINE